MGKQADTVTYSANYMGDGKEEKYFVKVAVQINTKFSQP